MSTTTTDHQDTEPDKMPLSPKRFELPPSTLDTRHGWGDSAENRRQNAIHRAMCVDDVNGIIFGGETRSVMLVSPNGNVQCRGHIEHDDAAKKWGEAAKAKLQAARTGDGRTLNEWPEIFESIYGKGEWEVRIF